MGPEHNRDCSCLNCDNAPEKIRAKGLKVNEIDCCENLTQRDRKMLKKLIQSRGAYNNVRDEIVSIDECDDSCCVAGEEEHLNKKQRGDRGDHRMKQAVRAYVDAVDKGEIKPSEKSHLKYKKPFVDCQTCCAYDNDDHHYKKSQMHKHKKSAKKVETYSSSHLHANRNIAKRKGKMRNVHFNTKHIRSDPCTCLSDILGIVNKEKKSPVSKSIDSKTPTQVKSKSLNAKRCVCECNLVTSSFTTTFRKKSSRIVQDAKDKMRRSIKSSFSNLEKKFRIKKDSMMLYRDKLKWKRAKKRIECEPDNCIPEECYNYKAKCNPNLTKIKTSFQNVAKKVSELSVKATKRVKRSMSNHVCICEPEPEPEPVKHKYYNAIRKSIDEIARIASDVTVKVADNIQSKRKAILEKGKSVHDIFRKSFEDIVRVGSDASINVANKIKSKRKPNHVCICEPEPEPLPEPKPEHKYYEKFKRSLHEISKAASGVSFKIVSKIKSKHKQKTKSKLPEIDNIYGEPIISKKTVKRSFHKTGLNIHIEPSKVTKMKKAQRIICKCENVDEKPKKKSEKIDTAPDDDSNNIYSSLKLGISPEVCEPFICVPGHCDYRKCAEILMSRYKFSDSSGHVSDKAVGGIPTKKSKHSQYLHEEPVKSDDTNVNGTRQVVRIGSNFSFNIEFYKDKVNSPQQVESTQKQEDNRKIKKKARGSLPRKVRSRNKATQPVKRKMCDSSTCHELKRCFCTLGLGDKPKVANDPTVQDSKIETDICECDLLKVQKTQTNIMRSKSFAQDSFFDSENECNPAVCKTRFGKSLQKRSVGTTSLNKCSLKSQCGDICMNKDIESHDTYNESKEFLNTLRESENRPSRNVVRIGSTFSFDIQFYKERLPQHDTALTLIDKNSSIPEKSMQNRKNSSTYLSTEPCFNSVDKFRNKCSTSCCRTKSSYTTTKSQTYPSNRDKYTSAKAKKVYPKNVCESDITDATRSTQISESVVYVMSPFCSLEICDPSCKLKNKNTGFNNRGVKCKRTNTQPRVKSVSSNTMKRLISNASSSKRQMLKHKLKKKEFRESKNKNIDQEDSLQRQAVRIESSFSFNVEFYKEKINPDQNRQVNNESITKKNKKVAKIKESNPNSKIRKCVDTPRHRQKSTQVSRFGNVPKVSVIKPFIDRCLCSMKLRKPGKETCVCQPKEIPKPQKCQTCQCELRKSTYRSLYQSKHAATDFKDFKSLSSGTSKSYMKCQKLQAQENKSINRDVAKEETYEDQVPRSNRQVVRIGSSFSFNIEFYKERGDYEQVGVVNQIKKQKKIIKKENIAKAKTRMDQNAQRRLCKKSSVQIQGKQYETKEIPASLIRRCFCSLKREHHVHKPQTKNKSMHAKESKRSHNKRILTMCACEKSIDTKSLKRLRQKSNAGVGPARLKSAICYTDHKFFKSRLHNEQFDLCKPCNQVNFFGKEGITSSSIITPQTKTSSLNFEKGLRKRRRKANQREVNCSKLTKMQKIARDKRITVKSKKGRISNIGSKLKNCLCKPIGHKNNPMEEKYSRPETDTVDNLPVSTCDRLFCQKNRKVKSVLDVKKSSIKTKKVKSNLREVSTKMHSDQSIKRELPKNRYRKKAPTRQVAHLGSAYKFDVEFYKQFGNLEDDGSVNYRKLKKNQRESNYNVGPLKRMSIENNNEDKRLFRPKFPHHREYQVGYMKCEVDTTLRSPFQRPLNVYHAHVPNKVIWKSSAVINPAIIQGTPYRNTNTKKRVTFQGSMDKNIQTDKKYREPRINHGGSIYKKNQRRNNFRNNDDGDECVCTKVSKYISKSRKGRRSKRNVKDQNKENMIVPTKYQDENMMLDIEIIKPYSKRNFRKTTSRNCLKHKCAIRKAQDDSFIQNKSSSKHILRTNKTYYGLLYAKKTLAMIRKSLHNTANTCNEICIAKGKTNLAKSIGPDLRHSFALINNKQDMNEHTIANDKAFIRDTRRKARKANRKQAQRIPKDVKNKDIKRGKKQKKIDIENKESPCLCGSSICGKVSKRMEKKEKPKKETPPCICGSKVCKEKSKREGKTIMKLLKNNICECEPDTLGHVCECSHTKQNLKIKKVDKKQKLRQKKAQEKKIQKIKKKPKKKESRCTLIKSFMKENEEKKLRKQYAHTSDKVLVAESVLDLGKMTFELIQNLIKGIFRFATKPKETYGNLKKELSDPSIMKKRCENSKFFAIGQRMQRRLASMRVTKDTKKCLEDNTYTNYVIHSCDKDPSKRLRSKKRLRRRKERMDFECSPYMASLRKRPYLWVYDRCPRIYPQFLSMIVLWRQFLDIMLFLIAIAVWSPCILSIEICRALMCCCLCTG